MSMRPQDIIRKKRDGGELSREEVASFVRGVVDGSWADYQASALLMAIVLRGMTIDETSSLTDSMVNSGTRVDLSDIPDRRLSLRGECSQQYRHARPDVRAFQVFPIQTVRTLDQTSIWIT